MKFTRPCSICNKPTKLFGAIRVKLMAGDGKSTLRLCDECAITLEAIRLLKNEKELPDDRNEKDEFI